MKLFLTLLLTTLSLQATQLDTKATSLHVNENSVFIMTQEGVYQEVFLQESTITLKDYTPLPKTFKPKNILRDGIISHGKKNIQSAWLSNETTEYNHGVIGDAIEAKSLSIVSKEGQSFTLTLDNRYVFEDRLARLYDIDKDGEDEIFVILSHADRGASLAMFELKDNVLTQTATTGYIEKAFRWLNVVGFGDVNGNGILDVSIVITPHIGGYLTTYEYKNGELIEVYEKYGFTNHHYGSSELGMSKVSDVDGDRTDELIVLEDDGHTLQVINYKDDRYTVLKSIKNPEKVDSAIIVRDMDKDGRKEVIYLLETGHLIIEKL